ncbi:MAG: hypothetical protein AB7P49_15300, partial [Bdellovibrionales bacterium]
MVIDAYAVIVQQDGDGGDTLHREGMYAFGKWLRYTSETNTLLVEEIPQRRDPASILDKFEVRPGTYVRHPDPTSWVSNPETTSRDQLIPVIAYCAAYADYPRLWRLFKAVAKRGFFAQNFIKNGPGKTQRKIPDTMLGHLGLFIRAGGWWTAPLYPVLLITDSLRLVNTLMNLIPLHKKDGEATFRWKNMGDVDDNNTIISHLVAARFKPTPISWLDRQIYALTRPINYGNTILGETNPVMGALAWYHRPEAGGNPELAELYRPLVEEHFDPMKSYQEIGQRLS